MYLKSMIGMESLEKLIIKSELTLQWMKIRLTFLDLIVRRIL